MKYVIGISYITNLEETISTTTIHTKSYFTHQPKPKFIRYSQIK